MNVLYLHSHDTGRYVQPYGYAVETPNLQRFAEQGVLFRQAFCANPTCSASRASLLTGQCAHSAGMLGLAHRGARLRDPSQHLAALLRRNGYATALAGVQHEAPHAERLTLGYDELLSDAPRPAGMDNDDWTAARAGAFLRRPHGKPFFLSCGFTLTHRMGKGVQWHNEGGSPLGDPRYVRPPAPLPDDPETRRDFADFRVAASRLDRLMGSVLDALDQAGRADDTLVILTTDHGIAFPLMKCNLTDHGTGVMLMMRAPRVAGFSGGRVVDALVSHVDVYPTVCVLAGVAIPPHAQGHALVDLVAGRVQSVRDAVFSEVNWHAAPEPMRTVRTARHRYIRRYVPRGGPVLPNCDDSVTKNLLRAHGWDTRAPAREALYDLVFDPNEACNRADDPAYAAPLAELRARLDAWMRATDDPLLAGRIEAPPGMVINPVDGVSPQDPPGPTGPIVVG